MESSGSIIKSHVQIENDDESVTAVLTYQDGTAVVAARDSAGTVEIKTDINGDGNWDQLSVAVDTDHDGVSDQVISSGTAQNTLFSADKQLDALHDQGLIGDEVWGDYTAWSTAQLINDSSTFPFTFTDDFYLPIGAFYESQSVATDHATSIADKTFRILDSANQAVTAEQLAAQDVNHDGKLSAGELSALNVWADTNEDGLAQATELSTLTTALASAGLADVRAHDYAFYTAGNANAVTENAQSPVSSFAAPASNYRALRDSDNVYVLNGNQFIAFDAWQVKINYSNRSYLIGTDGNDRFDANYYAAYHGSYFNTDLLVNFLAGGGNDEMGGSARSDNLWGGTGNDTLYGYDGDDKLYGEDDDDQLQGGNGADLLSGGVGNDLLFGQGGDDTLMGEDGADELQGGYGNDILDGGSGNDKLFGESGDDMMFGGVGADQMVGGLGNDYMHGGADNDLLIGSEGKDTLYGGTGDDELQGGSGNDQLYGEDGNDRFFGGAGNDTLYGGNGNDLLVGGVANNEAALAADVADNNFLYGGAGNDTLVGGVGSDYMDGGAGADSMEGGQGDDFYLVNSVNDVILEQLNEGYDQVASSANYILNANIEGLRLVEGFIINGTGNRLNNRIMGNSQDNILDGVTGADTMIGGLGNDTYYVDNVSDQSVELAGEGTDSVNSSISYTLSANLENLTLLDFSKAEKGIADGVDILVYGYPKAYELDYMQGDAVVGYSGTCALASIANLATQANLSLSEAQVVQTAIDNNWCVTSSTATDYQRGGSNYVQQQALLNSYGINNGIVMGYNEQAIANLIKGGRGVIMGLNAGKLWGDSNYLDNGAVNHVVTITGVACDAVTGAIKGFYIADSGRGLVSDMTRYVAIEDFRSHANVANAYSIYTIEPIKLWEEDIDATGNALDNVVTGNRGNNVIKGGAGNDTLNGQAGDDILMGQTGDDFLDGGAGHDVAVFAGAVADYRFNYQNGVLAVAGVNVGDGIDTLQNIELLRFADQEISLVGFDSLAYLASYPDLMAAFGTDAAAAMTHYLNHGFAEGRVVHFDASAYLAKYADLRAAFGTDAGAATLHYMTQGRFEGRTFDTTVVGNARHNVLDGRNGRDTLMGGAGDDSYLVDDAADQVVEAADGGNWDVVYTSVDRTIDVNVEALVVQGNATAYGDARDNSLYGWESAAANRLVGGAGNDHYNVDANDIVEETGNDSADYVHAYNTNIELSRYANVENAALEGEMTHLNVTGNSGNNTLLGNAGSNWLDGAGGQDTLIGRGGDDRYVVHSANDVVIEDARENDWDIVFTTADRSIDANVEALVAWGNANIYGDARDNHLYGWESAEANRLVGGAGNDHYLIGANDIVEETANDDGDFVQALDFNIELSRYANVENAALEGGADLSVGGTSGDNVLYGNNGSNFIDGRGGRDTLIGRDGNDYYIVDSADDVVIENADGGNWDVVYTSVDRTIDVNVEALVVQGNASAYGDARDNSLYGWESAAANRLVGGAGNDHYNVDANDIVEETGNDGADWVHALNFNIDLNRYSGIEHGVLEGWAEGLSITGSAGNNQLYGGSGNNLLIGGAGDDRLDSRGGRDTLMGGTGNDVYVVYSTEEVIDERVGEGDWDTVFTSVDRTIDANVEQIVTWGNATAYGDARDNIFYGWESAAANRLVGGAGNDHYHVDANDFIEETGNDSRDFVHVNSFDLDLNRYSGIELGELQGWAKLNITGNAGNNELYGNNGDNTLDGRGGNDILIGRGGNDTYLFGKGYNADTIQNYDASGTENDRVVIGAGVTEDQVWLQRSGDDLLLTLFQTNDTLTIDHWFSDPAYRVDSFELANGKQLVAAQVDALVSAMAAFAPPSGLGSLPSNYQLALNPALATSWR